METLRQAEELWRQGEIESAFERYRSALSAILRGGRAVDSAGLVALERFADLAVLVNRFEAAADSLRQRQPRKTPSPRPSVADPTTPEGWTWR